jgi:hypothetical protein
MSVLPVGRSLNQFFPDLDEFLQDPAAYLKAEPVAIGPRRAYGFAALFGALGGGSLLACAISGVWNDERLLLGIGLLIGASVWLGWSLRLRGHSLVLRPEGVEIRYFDTVVWCPWALFNADGPPVVPAGDNPRVSLILPVSPDAVPYIELRRHEFPVAHGLQVKVPQFRMTAPDQVMLAARYELAASDLGDLLLRLGGRLGRRLPGSTPAPEVVPAGDLALNEVAEPDRDGWYTIPLGRLRFPPRCCDCHQPTDAGLHLPLGDGDIAGRLTGTARWAELTIPICKDCQAVMRRAHHRSGSRGLNVGAVLGPISLVGFVMTQGEHRPVSLALAGLAGAAIGGLIGFLIGNGLTRPLPVRFRRYRPDKATLQVHFRDPHYADLVLAALDRKRSRT